MNTEDIQCTSAWEYHADNIPFAIDDIEEVLGEACTPGEYAEQEIVGVYKLKDGKGFAYVSGGCDTTGWDCQSGASGLVYDSLEELVTDDDRTQLVGSRLDAMLSTGVA